jgi:hypothetical protein
MERVHVLQVRMPPVCHQDTLKQTVIERVHVLQVWGAPLFVSQVLEGCRPSTRLTALRRCCRCLWAWVPARDFTLLSPL